MCAWKICDIAVLYRLHVVIFFSQENSFLFSCEVLKLCQKATILDVDHGWRQRCQHCQAGFQTGWQGQRKGTFKIKFSWRITSSFVTTLEYFVNCPLKRTWLRLQLVGKIQFLTSHLPHAFYQSFQKKINFSQRLALQHDFERSSG